MDSLKTRRTNRSKNKAQLRNHGMSTGIWSLEGDQLTVSESDGSDSETLTLNSVTDTEMTLTYKDEDGEETAIFTRET